MKKAIQISIASPCHENWDQMDKAEKGKFCGSCQKQVIDFTNMSDHEIAQFFKKPSTGSVCGRFLNDQLDREIVVPRKRIPWLKYFFQIAIPALLFSRASAQTEKPPKVDRTIGNDTMRVQAGHELKILGMVLPSTIIPEEKKDKGLPRPIDYKTNIKGRVVNESGMPVLSAQILSGGKVIAETDTQGSFCVQVNNLDKDSMVEVQAAGFQKQLINLGKDDAVPSELQVHLKVSQPASSKSKKKMNQDSGGLTGKTGGLTVVRNWEPRLFYRR